MSVYKPKNSRVWKYDFHIKGNRYRGSTGQMSRRAAEAVERNKRLEAATGKFNDPSSYTLEEAATRWWNEVWAHSTNPTTQATMANALEVMLKCIGPSYYLYQINNDLVATAISRRRGILVRGKYPPSNATINRTLIGILRPILNRAHKAWGAQNIPHIDWAAHKLKEPKEIVREFSDEEYSLIIRTLPEHWRVFAEFMLTYGPRLGEMFFHPDDVDLFGCRIRLRERKAGDDHTIPITKYTRDTISPLVGTARQYGLQSLWFKAGREGAIQPLSYSAAKSAFRRMWNKTGIKARTHDCRHHAGTTILRQTGNLRLAQKLLGHADIQSTTRYAHVVEDDLRSALEQYPHNIPTQEKVS